MLCEVRTHPIAEDAIVASIQTNPVPTVHLSDDGKRRAGPQKGGRRVKIFGELLQTVHDNHFLMSTIEHGISVGRSTSSLQAPNFILIANQIRPSTGLSGQCLTDQPAARDIKLCQHGSAIIDEDAELGKTLPRYQAIPLQGARARAAWLKFRAGSASGHCTRLDIAGALW